MAYDYNNRKQTSRNNLTKGTWVKALKLGINDKAKA